MGGIKSIYGLWHRVNTFSIIGTERDGETRSDQFRRLPAEIERRVSFGGFIEKLLQEFESKS